MGTAEGLRHASAAIFDHVQVVDKSRLTKRLGHLGEAKMRAACHALAVATGCIDD